jgi:hypothetical protein
MIFVGCSHNNASLHLKETKMHTKNLPAQEKLLNYAYLADSDSLLDTFFNNWAATIKPLSQESYNSLDEGSKETYDVVRAFYNPEYLYESEWSDSLYKDVKYYILRSQIRVCMTDSIQFCTKAKSDSITMANLQLKAQTNKNLYSKDFINADGSLTKRSLKYFKDPPKYSKSTTTIIKTIQNFYPQISSNGKGILYLTDNYEKLLNKFIGFDFETDNNLMSPSTSERDSEKKQDFLEKNIKIFASHWGEHWEIETAPVVTDVIFNKEFSLAIVEFSVIYQGGLALLRKVDNKWIVEFGKLTWIT